jgi:Mg-chelatase subunit ChlD
MNPTLRFPVLLFCLGAAIPAQEGQSTFGHARARELAELGRLPTSRDVVVRDIVNFHRHRLPLPKADQDVALDVRFDRSAARGGDSVALQIGYTTRPAGDRTFSPPCSVALVVDTSGSMAERGKMDQVKAGLREFARNLRQDDEVALVEFNSQAKVLASRRRVGDGRWLAAAIDELRPGGNTNLHAGLMLGLRELPQDDHGDRPRRVVLLTDGIANRGVTEPAAILADARDYTAQAIDVSTIGVGENLDVALLQQLSSGTRGLFHFVADEQQVQKVFAQELDSLLQPAVRRPRLFVTLPEDLTVERVFHDGAEPRGGGLQIDLRDLNAGCTGVVIVRCRVADGAREPLAVRAELRFETATTERRGEASAQATLSLRADERPEVDVEVRKNHAIAVLAQGLADMARASEERRWAEADRALQLARDESQRLFPGEDPDLQRVRDIAAGHARTLLRYVDRFRDF